jgi:hypothetical protein
MDDKKLKLKYKQLKYQHLKKIYHKNLNKLPCNCKYNKTIELPNRTKINICGFNLEDNFEIDLCYKPEHAKNCNAFCPKKSKEELYKDFIDEVKDDVTRSANYKDINTLYWVYPELKFEEFPETKKWYSRVILWLKNLL